MSTHVYHPFDIHPKVMAHINREAIEASDHSVLAMIQLADRVSVDYADDEECVREVVVWFKDWNSDKMACIGRWDPNNRWEDSGKLVSFLCTRLSKPPPPVAKPQLVLQEEGDTGQYPNAEGAIVYLINGEEVEPQVLVKHLMDEVERLQEDCKRLELAVEDERNAHR